MALQSDDSLTAAIECCLVMGVCGAGKSRVGAELARRLDLPFIEADDYHSAENRVVMALGNALTDAQRLPWLEAVADAVVAARLASDRPVVLACSALRRTYRDRLRARVGRIYTFHLDGPRPLLAARLADRKNHFVGPDLLDSQLAVIEPLQSGEYGSALEISAPLDAIVVRALERLAALVPQADRDPGENAPDRRHRNH